MEYSNFWSTLQQARATIAPLLSSRFVTRWLLHGILAAAFVVVAFMTIHNLVSGENEGVVRRRLIKEVGKALSE